MVIGFAIEFLLRTSKLKQKSEKMRLVHWQNVGQRKKLVQKHVSLTDDHPWAHAIVIIDAQPLA